MDTRGYTTALVDFGQVVSQVISEQSMRGMAAITGQDLDTFSEAYWRLRHGYDVDLPPADYWGGIAGRRLEAAEVERLVLADNTGWSTLNPDTVAVLRAARTAGIRLALLSNAPAVFAPAFRALPIAQLFGLEVFSGEVGVAKPDPEIFTLALERCGVQPADAFFVDDRPPNVEAARSVGIAASVFTDAAALRADLGLDAGRPT